MNTAYIVVNSLHVFFEFQEQKVGGKFIKADKGGGGFCGSMLQLTHLSQTSVNFLVSLQIPEALELNP